MAELDLATSILGIHVPSNAGTLKWTDGHTTILPLVYGKSRENLCKDLDIPLITFMAGLPSSTVESTHVTHFTRDCFASVDVLDMVGGSLSNNKPVVIRGPEAGNKKIWTKITTDYLDTWYGISPNRSACIIDIGLRAADHLKPYITGTIASFLDATLDDQKIQCILDIPLAHVVLPEPLRIIDHGLVYGWNETAHLVPIKSDVHPDNFTAKGWGLLHHPGVVTYPHQDAEGTLTWTRMEVGMKFWAVFYPKRNHNDRMHLEDIARRLTDFISNQQWLMEHCHAEVITLFEGDILIQPPSTLHAVYTPVPSFSTGGHFYHYECMHLTELARYIDSAHGDCTTNQEMSHALETIRRMTIAVPRISPYIRMYKRSLISLCIMAQHGSHYQAVGGRKNSSMDRETAEPAIAVANTILKYLGASKKSPAYAMLQTGTQYDRGERIDRGALDGALKEFLM